MSTSIFTRGRWRPPAFKTLQLMRTDRSETSILALRTGLGVHNQTCRKINLFLGTNNVVIAQSGRASEDMGNLQSLESSEKHSLSKAELERMERR